MLSGRLVRLIEEHAQDISNRVILEVRRNPEFKAIGKLPDSAICTWCERILPRLGYWLAASTDREIADRYAELGRVRFNEDVPLHEAVLRFIILKDKIIDFALQQGLSENMVQLYAEEELERRIS